MLLIGFQRAQADRCEAYRRGKGGGGGHLSLPQGGKASIAVSRFGCVAG